MGNDYAPLLNKYNRLFAQAQDLQQQLLDKAEHSKKQGIAFSKTIAAAKVLCEDILAKDPQEMILGRSYSWNDIGIDELLAKSLKSFREYNATRTHLLRQLKDESEDRRLKIDSLMDQVNALKLELSRRSRGNDDDAPDDENDTESDATEDVSAGNKPSKATSGLSPAPYKMQKAAEDGQIELIIEEDNDLTERDMSDIEEAMKMADAVSVQTGDIPVKPSGKKKKHKVAKEEARMEAHVINLAEVKSQITSYMWLVVEAIGTYGLSKYPAIETKVFELWEGSIYQQEFEEAKRGKLTSNRVRTATLTLASAGAIESAQISDALQSRFLIYRLTAMGAQIYNDKYGKRPELSEWDNLITDHDNAEHGYGIIGAAEVFKASGFFTSVTFTRKENRIKVDERTSYEADIITSNDKYTNYYEYERGYHNQVNFNIKLNKIAKITGIINILVPNQKVLSGIKEQVDRWIESRGGHAALASKKVRLTTVKSLVGKDPHDHKNWAIVYNMKSDKPIINTPTTGV